MRRKGAAVLRRVLGKSLLPLGELQSPATVRSLCAFIVTGDPEAGHDAGAALLDLAKTSIREGLTWPKAPPATHPTLGSSHAPVAGGALASSPQTFRNSFGASPVPRPCLRLVRKEGRDVSS